MEPSVAERRGTEPLPKPPARFMALAPYVRLPRPRGRRIAAWCAIPPLATASVVLGCRAADTDGITPVPQLLAFLPWLLVPVLLALLLAVAARWAAGCVWALVAAAATGWFTQPYDGPAGPEPSGPVVARLRVLSANLEYGGATDGLLSTLRRERPDLVSVQECDVRCAAALDSPAVRASYPYRNVVTGAPAEGSAILSRHPLRNEEGIDATLAMPRSVATVHGQRVHIQVAHPMPPEPGGVDLWRAELGRLRAYAAGRGGEATMVAGDFNATQDHAAFRSVLDTGLRDSARATGASRTPSWPSLTAPVLGAQIDHVLVSDTLRPRAARFLDLAHTDHRALLVDLDLYAAP
ncbi:endonuclease/exonuclease/phosphatase family protein [Streptomyces sp. XD-27]|uniref:endonuclease/exonuclease/phosphatase family protein n=1 Tax=Streptomyces sp. XD-27 TaxID=3062779 RepID=UPI00350E4ECB